MKILVIDDDDRLRRLVEKVLTLGGHEVLAAANGAEGMAIFRKESPEIVVTDIVMPEQEGLGTIMMMRRECPKARIIAMSGGGRVGNLDVLGAAHALGSDEVIAKPFLPRDLLDLINRLVSDSAAAGAKTTLLPPKDPGATLRRLAAMSRRASPS
ncbi:MAG TPA: response regulator [Stellaceae bacterium]|nr:response regulator [Stellaceae bacterium]